MPAPEPAPAVAPLPEVRGAAREVLAGTRIGLLAGFGRFPFLFADLAKQRGLRIVTIGMKGEASPDLAAGAEAFHWCGVAQVGRMIRLCKREGLTRVVMAGKVHKVRMYDPLRIVRHLPDWRTLKLWYRHVRDRKDDTLLGAVAEELRREGITLESAADLTPELLAPAGTHSARAPTPFETRDIAFGWEVAKRMGDLDIGQTVAVKEQVVLAVEAIEGTDQAIRRAGTLCRGRGFTVVKVAKPRQDMRWDVPTVGPETIKSLTDAGASCLAVEAGKTYLLDADQTLGAADATGLAVVAVTGPPAAP